MYRSGLLLGGRGEVKMPRIMLKSKIHRAKVTGVNLEYEGSISIDSRLLEAADIAPYERVSIYNLNNGERFDTYAMPDERNSGRVVVNGAAARLAQPGDLIIVASYVIVSDERVIGHKPKIVLVDEHNSPRK